MSDSYERELVADPVPVGSSCTVDVTFHPTGPFTEEAWSATLIISGSNGGSQSIDLLGDFG